MTHMQQHRPSLTGMTHASNQTSEGLLTRTDAATELVLHRRHTRCMNEPVVHDVEMYMDCN